MEDVYNELDLVKDELDKLKAEFRTKSELCESLKNAHNKQSLRVEESQQKIEKQSHELRLKCEEIAEAMKLAEELESRLQAKELSLRDLSSLNEKLKAESEQRMKYLEGENRDLGSTLNEVTTRNKDLEKEVCASSQQIEGLKSLLSVTETKYLQAKRMAQEGKEYKRRDDVIGVLEDEKANFQDQLKWKEEQFKHLEEAHSKLQDQFRMSEEDREREKSALVEESCSLQTRLDSQTRAAEGLRARLEMCNNALAHEESKRRSLEAHVSDLESRFQRAFAQFEGETSEIQSLSIERDEEIAKLRNLLGIKEMVLKEREAKIMHLEQENQELRGSLKELQEAQIRYAGTTSSAKLLNKLRRLEQAYGNCSAKLKEKESELLSEIESIRKNVNSCKSELEDKVEEVKKLQIELESCRCKVQELSVEISMILEVLKSELSEDYSTAYNVKLEMEVRNQEMEDTISLHAAQLEMKREGLAKARLELEEEHKRVISLTERLKSNPSTINSSLGEDREICSLMENSFVPDEAPEILENERVNLHCVLQQKDKKIEDLLQQIVLLEGKLAAKVDEMEASLQDNKNLAQIAKENDICIENLRNDFAKLKQESRRRELEIATLARLDVVKDFTEEKEMLLRVITEKEQRIKNLMVLATSLERDLPRALVSSFQDVVEKQVKIGALTEALEKRKSVTDQEIKEKNRLIANLENEASTVQERLTHQEESFLFLKLELEHLQVLMKCNVLEMENFMDEPRRLEGVIKKLESDKKALLQENSKLSTERESLVAYIQKVCDEIGNFSSEDAEMMKALGKMLPRAEEKIEVENNFHVSIGEKVNAYFSTKTNNLEASINERSPLKEVNLWQR